jgi:hypothetical protein
MDIIYRLPIIRGKQPAKLDKKSLYIFIHLISLSVLKPLFCPLFFFAFCPFFLKIVIDYIRLLVYSLFYGLSALAMVAKRRLNPV